MSSELRRAINDLRDIIAALRELAEAREIIAELVEEANIKTWKRARDFLKRTEGNL